VAVYGPLADVEPLADNLQFRKKGKRKRDQRREGLLRRFTGIRVSASFFTSCIPFSISLVLCLRSYFLFTCLRRVLALTEHLPLGAVLEGVVRRGHARDEFIVVFALGLGLLFLRRNKE
jgi:hypothetical protein